MSIRDFGNNSLLAVKGLKERVKEAERKELQMRPIKFRAWDTKHKKMWSAEEMGKDQLTLSPDGRGFINVSGTSTRLSQYLPHLIPLQFTGLKDKNGKGDEVYKDDVVSSFNGVKYHVYWDTEYGQWWARIVNKTKGKYTQPLCEILDNSYMHIIGNIHQPELMEQNNG